MEAEEAGEVPESQPIEQAEHAPGMEQDGPGRIKRERPDPIAARAALVKEWCSKVISAKAHWEKVFKRMREDMDFVSGMQWKDQNDDCDLYTANITQRHVAMRVAALYAKNPRVVAKRKPRMDFALWSGEAVELQNAQNAMALAQQAGMPPDPQIMALMQDAHQGAQNRMMFDKVSKTLETLFEHVISGQSPDFKAQMKQLVRRVCVTGVGYVKVGFERATQPRPEDIEKIRGISEQIALIERLAQDIQDGKSSEDSKDSEQLKLLMQELQSKPEVVVREGVVFDFPPSTSIIIDPKCRQLSAFVGAEWIAQEFMMSPDAIKEIYKVDVGSAYTAYKDGKNAPGEGDKESECCSVWEIYSKKDRMVYVVVDGYPDFLVGPSSPYPELEGFWPIFPLVFNEVENEKQIFPQSDVRLIRPIQLEYNRVRQGLREHRAANRPAYAVPFGMLDQTDKDNLANRPPHAVIELRALQAGQAVDAVLQHIKPVAIDPALYDASMLVDDTLRIIGSQEANLGGTAASGTTATEVSVAESTRMSSVGSNVDDLDEFLSVVCRAAGEIMLKEFSQEYVARIVGPGAVWPQLSRADIVEQLYLEIEAGSSGRPNKAVEVQNWERLAPILMQIPGVSPEWMARETIRRLDDKIDPTDIIIAAVPSIIAMNAQKQMAVGPPGQDPNAQGAQGAQNAPQQSAAPGAAGPEAPSAPVM